MQTKTQCSKEKTVNSHFNSSFETADCLKINIDMRGIKITSLVMFSQFSK